MPSLPEFHPEPALEGAALRSFLAQRRAFPRFRTSLAVSYVHGLRSARQGERTLLWYVHGTLPVAAGPLGRGLRAQEHTILEAHDPAWSFGTGQAVPRRGWAGRLARWLPGKQPVRDPRLGARFVVRGRGADPWTLPVVEALIVASEDTVFAWSASRVMVQRLGNLQHAGAGACLEPAMAIVEALPARSGGTGTSAP